MLRELRLYWIRTGKDKALGMRLKVGKEVSCRPDRQNRNQSQDGKYSLADRVRRIMSRVDGGSLQPDVSILQMSTNNGGLTTRS